MSLTISFALLAGLFAALMGALEMGRRVGRVAFTTAVTELTGIIRIEDFDRLIAGVRAAMG